ncbi:MAG: hypothetical protein ACJ8EA_23155, partial [Xanthobacteraceae bacterium]
HDHQFQSVAGFHIPEHGVVVGKPAHAIPPILVIILGEHNRNCSSRRPGLAFLAKGKVSNLQRDQVDGNR